MSKHLTQGEIDAILQYVKLERNSLADAGVSAGTVVRSHNFAAPAPVSREALRALHAVHESYLYTLVSALSAQMRAMVEVEFVGTDQMSYQEYILSLRNPTVLCVFDMEPLDGEGVIEIHPPLVAAMIDRLFGGEGEMPEEVRELTPIEQAVLSRIMRQSITDLGEAWGEAQSLNLSLKTIERNPQFLQVLSPSEIVLLVTFEVKVEHSVGLMSVCYPLMALEPVLKRIETRSNVNRVKPWSREDGRNPLEEEVLGVRVDVAAELGRAEVSVRDLVNLKEGDVLRLGQRFNEEIRVLIGSVPKLRGRPGVKRKQRAVLITAAEKGMDHVESGDSGT